MKNKKSFIGQFIYNQDEDFLYKYELVDPDTLNYYHSIMLGAYIKRNPTLHKDIMVDEDRAHCRGRVVYYKETGFCIIVGNWGLEFPKAIKLVRKTFNLPKSTPVLVHEHWDISHNINFE